MYISGLASGLDTDTLIKQLMDIERIPLTRLQQRKSQYNLEKNAWHDVYVRISSLWNTLGDLKLASTFNSFKATSSNEAALTATADSNAVPASYEIDITQLAKPETVASSSQVSTADNVSLGLPAGKLYINFDDGTSKQRYIDVDSNSTLQSIVEAINIVPPTTSDPGAGDIVTASIVDHKLVITSKTSGSGVSISFSDDASGAITDKLYLTSPTEIQRGQDAQFSVNGLAVTRSKNTVDDVIQGVTLNLKGVTNGAVNLQIASDTQRAIDAVNAFVAQYNSVMDFIATKLGDKGDLQSDPTLMAIQEKLRQLASGIVSGVTGPYKSLQDIGISTGEVVGSGTLTFDRSGKLTINTDKLTAALEKDADAVYQLFYNNSGTGGVAVSFDIYLTFLIKGTGNSTYTKGILVAQEDAAQNIIDDIDDQIARMEDRLAMKEEQLRRQFTAMEQALAALQSQGNWLAGQIAGLGAYQWK
ncbi:Flagellin hook, IN motif [Moorella glycerini]|uniref:Flagellar hook-associated protein 2 n=1 Tax=Neomoorella stamsii TaxID=1266720 RepID=A0A9X7J2K8_9FIRM|nr:MULTISPECIES: flagellar filament capping protein FliD [Moorella]PRR72303.1 Flagellar hook-associated protein 2 [Moorella stamsii]CEP68886.1 Flagellin hook, IN motif [Moorella glycerini]